MPKQTDEELPVSNIIRLLTKIDRPVSYCSSGTCPTVLPGLCVDGLGDLGLPLSPTDAKRLIKLCVQAPYGKGTETVVDTNVRKVWELDPQKFTLGNPKWTPMIDSVLREVEAKLGLPPQTLSAHLYKLLLYEKGSFFLPHRDGEKIDGMVATLVVALPSKHTGGELVVLHGAQRETIAMTGAASGLEIDYAAFYADCEHEVKKLSSGYRLCLTYNLAVTKARSKTKITAPDFQQVTKALTKELSQWSNDANALGLKQNKLAILLEHGYTEASLSVTNLKGIDRAKAEAMFEAAEIADCDAYLGLVTLWQSGQAEGGYDHGYGHRGQYSRWGDDEDETSTDSTKYTMGEVNESSLSALVLSDQNGQPVDFGSFNLDDKEIVEQGNWDDHEPSEEEFEGYTGNAGMTLERWYHRAAVLIWPRSCRFDIWCQSGTESAITGLAHMIRECQAEKKNVRTQKLETCRQFAAKIIDSWEARQSTDQSTLRQSMFSLLETLNAVELAWRLLGQTMLRDAALTPTKQALVWLAEQGRDELLSSLETLVSQSKPATMQRDVRLLRELVSITENDQAFKSLCGQLAPILVQAIEKHDALGRASVRSSTNLVDLITDVVLLLCTLDESEPLNRFLVWSIHHPKVDLIEVQIPALTKAVPQLTPASRRLPALRDWIKAVRTELELRTSCPPVEPTDWRRNGQLSCKCADCAMLSAFLEKPDVQIAVFPLAKQRRQHLHRMIDQHQCDCTHETQRGGRPEKLVCKKTNASYAAACLVHAKHLAHLRTIDNL